nr:sigma 54-interacting transcriptional regulator [Geoanaerobacter pelophilus]
MQAIRLFSGLDEADLSRIACRLRNCVFLSGMVILSKDEPADALFFILDGRVRVELQEATGQILNIAELGKGEHFGERAILTGEPRTADVRAITEVRAAKLLRSDFEELLSETPLLYANLCRDLARLLGSWAQRHQRDEREHREVMTNVIGWQLLPEFGAFPGNSLWVKDLNRRLDQLGSSPDNVLILGEPGTWKELAARLIHFHGDIARPVLFLDCSSPPPVIGQSEPAKQGGKDESLLETEQEVALFGHAPEGAVYSRRVRRGMLELASGGDMILQNVDCLTLPMQERLLSFIKSGSFKRHGESEWRFAQVRIIATSGEPLAQLAQSGAFNQELLDNLGSETIMMSPLRERKKDIPVIARSLLRTLNTKHHKNVVRLSQDALNLLVDHDWPLNGSELYQVLSRAVVVCDGEELLAEQIFLQGQLFEGGRFNLLTLPAVENLARRPDFPRILRWTTVPLFLVVLLYTLFGPVFDNAANLAVWTLWWPALLLTGFFFARGWCSYCPLEAIGEFLGTSKRVVREPSDWLRQWGPTFSLSGLVVIILAEQATGMFSWAFATGMLLLTLLTTTITGDLYLGRRGWCKYLCPLGRIVSLISRIAMLEMHSNHNVCVSRCRVDDCVREKGCPMGLHPTGIDNADHCVLCLDCVRNCPHHSMQLDLRNPSWGVLNQARRGFHEAVFSITLVAVVIAAKGTPFIFGRQPEVFPQRVWEPAELLTALLIAASFTGMAMLFSVGGRSHRWKATFTICSLAYLPLAFTGLFVYYFRALVEGGAELVPLTLAAIGLGEWLDLQQLTPDFGTLRLLIYPTIVSGGVFSWIVLNRLKRHYNLHRFCFSGHRLMVVITAAVFLCIL